MPHRKCKNINCILIASFGYKDRKGTQFCSKHKESEMINLLCKLCSCGRARPTYNYEGLTAKFCVKCKDEKMINVNDKKCIECNKVIPAFNYKGLKAEYCSKCKKEGMINLVNKPCICGYSSRPNFNFEGLKPEYCSKCKEDGMINVTHKKCFCGKVQASFNYEGMTPLYCCNCKLEGMVQLKKRVCIECNVYQANFNYIDQKPMYCSKCKKDGMENLVCKCKNQDCYRYGNQKYKYYCTHCFENLFPNDPLTSNIRIKSKENYVRDFLNFNFDGFIHDNPLYTGNCDCTHRRRIDHRKLIGNTLLCIETDEFQHKKYDETDEEIRYDDLYMLHGGKFIFIRFNPDSYINTYGTKVNPCMKRRTDVLEKEIYEQIARIENDENEELLEIVYLFYDGYGNV